METAARSQIGRWWKSSGVRALLRVGQQTIFVWCEPSCVSFSGERRGAPQRQDGEETEEIRRGQVEKTPPAHPRHLVASTPAGSELSRPVNTSKRAR